MQKNLLYLRNSDSMLMISVDDKGVRRHKRSLIVGSASNLKALDHDFHVCGIVPSVAFAQACESFFSRSCLCWQSPWAVCHATELSKLIKSNFGSQASRVVLLISDGGPYHRLTCLSVKVALIALFLNLNVDMLIAIRTHPHQSWSINYGRKSYVNTQSCTAECQFSTSRNGSGAWSKDTIQDDFDSVAWSNREVTFSPSCILWLNESSDCSSCCEIQSNEAAMLLHVIRN